MITLGNRRSSQPIVRKPDSSVLMPIRIPFDERRFEEGWLQDLIESTPEILPVAEIEPAFAPLISIGKNVSTSVGPMDNLLLSLQGYLTVVETKLWRNPDARRTVVGQIIDYATQLSQWSYEDLEKCVRAYNQRFRGRDLGILETLRLSAEIPENEESAVIDTISRNLRMGRFLLLVVGDGIREDVEKMANFFSRTPQLHFTLALVELQVYEMDMDGSESLLVVPQVVTRTREVVRAVVRVEGDTLRLTIDTEKTDDGKRVRLTEQDYFEALKRSVEEQDVNCAHQIINDMLERECSIDWGVGSFIVKLPDPGGSGEKLTLFVVGKDGKLYVGWLPNQLEKVGLPKEIAFDFVRKSAQLFEGCEVNDPNDPEWWRNIPSLRQVRQHYDNFLSIVQEAIDKIKQGSESSATRGR